MFSYHLMSAGLISLVLVSGVQGEHARFSFAGVGYTSDVVESYRLLVDDLNEQLKDDGFSIDEPVSLSYLTGLAAAQAGEFDIMLLTPMVYAAALPSTDDERDWTEIAIQRKFSLDNRAVDQYEGLIIYDPLTVLPTNLRLLTPTKERGKPVIAVIPLSSSGFYFPLDTLVTRGVIQSPKPRPAMSLLQQHFEVRFAASHSQALDWFFLPVNHPDHVDVACVYDGSIQSFSKSEERRLHMGTWAQHRSIDVPQPDRMDSIVQHCTYDKTNTIPESVLVVRKSAGPEFANLLKRELNLLDEKLSQARSSSPGVRVGLGRHIAGFKVGNDADIREEFKEVVRVYRQYRPGPGGARLDAFNLVRDIAEDIQFQLHVDKRYRPKIAVVLPGGGASGAYQAGVLSVLAEAFNTVRAEHETRKEVQQHIRPHLFVGTSVGAINAVGAALAVTQNGEWSFRNGGDNNWLESFWRNIKSENVLASEPGAGRWDWMYASFWLFARTRFLLLLIAMAIVLVLQVWVAIQVVSPVSTTWVFWCEFLTAMAAIAVVGYRLLPESSIAECVSLALIALWLVLLFVRRVILPVKRRDNTETTHAVMQNPSNWPAKVSGLIGGAAAIVAIVLLSQHPLGPVAFWLVLLWPFTLLCAGVFWKATSAEGSESRSGASWTASMGRVARNALALPAAACVLLIVPAVVGGVLADRPGVFAQNQLTELLTRRYGSVVGETQESSEVLVSNKVTSQLSRHGVELAITATELRNGGGMQQPREIYFHRSEHKPALPGFRSTEEWINLDTYRDKLLEAVISSAAVFPGFEPKRMKLPERQLLLVDGGYLHNVPVDAAIQMKATHVIVIRVHPEVINTDEATGHEKLYYVSFFDYLSDAFSLLFERAQERDYVALFGTRSYLIAPSNRPIGTLDFDGVFDGWMGKRKVTVGKFLDQGREDAMCASSDSTGFRRLAIGSLRRK